MVNPVRMHDNPMETRDDSCANPHQPQKTLPPYFQREKWICRMVECHTNERPNLPTMFHSMKSLNA